MKWLDRYLRDARIAQALPFIPEAGRLLDVGCFDQTLLRKVAPKVREAVGIDPLARSESSANIRIVQGTLPWSKGNPPDVLAGSRFDCITMLAVLEHMTDKQAVARECARLLAPGGKLIITVPHPRVDSILAVLHALRLIEGMSLEEHHAYDIRQTTPTFTDVGLKLHREHSFELGLNRLFVFEKPRQPQPSHTIVRTSHRATAIKT